MDADAFFDSGTQPLLIHFMFSVKEILERMEVVFIQQRVKPVGFPDSSISSMELMVAIPLSYCMQEC